MTPAPGKIIGGKYRLVKPLASGGMGSVWVAHHVGLDVDVAVKVISAALAASPIAQSRFEREAKASARLKSPHVVQVHDFGVEDGAPYLAMELLHGEDLGTLLERERRLSPARAAAIFTQACKGIKAAHDAGIVHRDIKPSNIFLARMGDDEVVKVLDFGIARGGEVEGADRTASGALLGTPLFMSPEQAAGREAGPEADSWSLAVVLYAAITGELPFAGASMGEIIAGILRDAPPPPSRAAPGLGPSFDRFFEKALAREPERRFASPVSMADAFSALAGAELPATLPGTSVRQALTGPPTRGLETAPTMDATPEMSSRRRGPSPREASSSAETLAPGEASSSAETLAPGEASSGAKGTSSAEAAAPRRRGRGWIWGAAGLAVAAILAAAVGWPRRDAADPGPVTSATAAPPKATAITELPPPVSDSPQALRMYSEALQAFRDANWDRAEARLREAVSLDPAFAAAHLRLAMTTSQRERAEARKSHARAVDGRARLSARDRELLAIFEPILREPSDVPGAVAVARKAVLRYPMDAELVLFNANLEMDRGVALELSRRAVELDPMYADGWQLLAGNLLMSGRPAESLQALDRCLAISSTSVDCLTQRASTYKGMGRCPEMEADFRQALALHPEGVYLHEARIDALRWLGRPPETILEASRQKWAIVPAAERRAIELMDRAKIDVLAGQFTRAEEEVRELQKLSGASADLQAHREQTALLISIAEETGRPRDAARAAEAYLLGREVWGGGKDEQDAPPMWRVMVRGGLLSREEYAKRLQAWVTAHGSPSPPLSKWDIWVLGHVGHVTLPEEALAGLAALPSGDPPPDRASPLDTEMGSFLVLAGKPEEALALFRRAQQSCDAASARPGVLWFHGQALEAHGDAKAACEAYAAVIERWGAAVPRSVTAEKARARMAALRCGK